MQTVDPSSVVVVSRPGARYALEPPFDPSNRLGHPGLPILRGTFPR
jgi:hypothetical protein